MLAAGAAGRGAALSFAGEMDGLVVDLAGSAEASPLFDAIVARQCTRSEYDGSSLDAATLRQLENAARVEGCSVLFIDEPARVAQALDLVIAANTEQVTDPAFRSELKSWLRFSTAKAIATGNGLYSPCSGNPMVPDWLGNLIFDFIFTADAENERTARQIRSSSGLAVFVGDRNDPAGWVEAGRAYQRFALKATLLGLRTAFLNQPVEVAESRREFAAWLGIGDKRPEFLVRYGRGPAMPKSLRRPVEAVIKAA